MVEPADGVVCPCCGNEHPSVIGPLPSSTWFAGKELDHPIPGGSLHRCPECNLVFRFPVETSVASGQLYDNETTETWSFEEQRNDHKLIREYVDQTIPRGGNVLDFGCYTGELLARLGGSYKKYGLEISHAAAQIAAEHADGAVFRHLDEVPSDLRFDAILTADVIEHVVDPGGLLAELSSVLSPGGKLLITTGDAENKLWRQFGANWWYCFYPEHISFLSRAWLNYAAAQHELRIEHCHSFHYSHLGPVRRFLDYLQTQVYGRFPAAYLRLAGAVRGLLNRPPVASVPGSGVSPDHLFVVLTRKDVD